MLSHSFDGADMSDYLDQQPYCTAFETHLQILYSSVTSLNYSQHAIRMNWNMLHHGAVNLLMSQDSSVKLGWMVWDSNIKAILASGFNPIEKIS